MPHTQLCDCRQTGGHTVMRLRVGDAHVRRRWGARKGYPGSQQRMSDSENPRFSLDPPRRAARRASRARARRMRPRRHAAAGLGLAAPLLLLLFAGCGPFPVGAQPRPPPPRPPPPRPPSPKPPAACVNTTFEANTVNLVAAKTNSSLPQGWTRALTVSATLATVISACRRYSESALCVAVR